MRNFRSGFSFARFSRAQGRRKSPLTGAGGIPSIEPRRETAAAMPGPTVRPLKAFEVGPKKALTPGVKLPSVEAAPERRQIIDIVEKASKAENVCVDSRLRALGARALGRTGKDGVTCSCPARQIENQLTYRFELLWRV